MSRTGEYRVRLGELGELVVVETFMQAAVESLCSVLVRQRAGRARVRAGVGLKPAGRLAAGRASGDG